MISDLLASLLGTLLGGGLFERRRRRRLARDLDEGRPLVFPGSVIGDAAYCRPAGGMLRLDGASLSWLTGRGGMSFPVPVERLAARTLAAVRTSDAFTGGENVAVVCDDDELTVRIVVLKADLPYLAVAVPGLRSLLAQTDREG